MNSIDLYYQGEGLREIQYLEAEAIATFAAIKARLAEKHGLAAEILVFLEDQEEPIAEHCRLTDHAGPAGLKLHLHRCRNVAVKVTFNGKTVDRSFGPGATIARVKRWAAERKFGMTKEEAGEHVLQISGSHDRPPPNTHIGALVTHGKCMLAFDLVPDERINGAAVDR